MDNRNHWRIKRLTPSVQMLRLQRDFSSGVSRTVCGKLIWRGQIRPSPLSCEYTVEMRYRPGTRPVVRVVEPTLLKLEGKGLPHVYPKDELCVYFPRDWDGTTFLTDTVIPWVSEWLFHYEVWLATGQWCGGGIHPSIKRKSAIREEQETQRETAAKME